MIHYILLLLSAVVYYFLGYQTIRENFNLVCLLFAINGLIYLYWLSAVRDIRYVNRLLVSSIFLRAVLLFSTPNLSDDVYRFIWDGNKIVNGKSPYAEIPKENTNAELYAKLNSKNYFSVYPPVNQLFFTVAGYYYKHSEKAAIFSLHVMVLLIEILMIILLRKLLLALKIAPWKSLIYALNPLVIIEISGNLHFEGVMLFFLLLSWWLYVKQKPFWAGISFGLAAGVKLSVLIFLPYLLWVFRKHFVAFSAGLVLSLITVFSWFYFHQTELFSFMQSVDLYFHTFEFNASVYYIIRAIGTYILGYNPIKTVGTWLGITSFISILIIYFSAIIKQNNKSKINFCPLLWAYTIYLLLASTVHPWYIINLVFLAVFCSQSAYAIIWSLLVIVSYHAYQYMPVKENSFLLIFEYATVLLLFFYEYFIAHNQNKLVI
jgi:hypothetical protein